jgi:hypothetical protein
VELDDRLAHRQADARALVALGGVQAARWSRMLDAVAAQA